MLNVLELFGGIGAPRKALTNLGVDFKVVDYVEIDKYAVKSYNAIYNENYEPQDICKWDKDINVDMIIHGSPCQSFSIAGLQQGGDKNSGTASSLMYESVRIIQKLKPKYVVWENVKNMLSKTHRHNFDNYLQEMESLGYKNYYKVLNAKDYDTPQNRERVFTVSVLNDKKFEFPKERELTLKLLDLLEKEVDEKYYLSAKMLNYCFDINNVQNDTKWSGRVDNSTLNCDIAHTLSVRGAGGNQRVGVSNFVIDGYSKEIKAKYFKENLINNENIRVRKLTPKECFRIMGFTDEDYEKASAVNSNAQLYKQAGNSIVVNVLQAIFNELLKGE